MTGNELLGILFANTHDSLIHDMTQHRAMGSVPFGGRYRMIDFALSNLVNAGASKVGVVTNEHYSSLMDHLGSGKPWDLSRKIGGLYLLPPFGSASKLYGSRHFGGLQGNMEFIDRSSQAYVAMCDADVALNLDMQELIDRHEESGADITMVCRRGPCPMGKDDMLIVKKGRAGRVSEIRIAPAAGEDCLYALDIFLLRRELLLNLLRDAIARGCESFSRDILMRGVKELRIYAHEHKGFTAVIDGMATYLGANMALLDKANRDSLFDPARPVFTKIYDEVPATYGLSAVVSQTLVADGCHIEGDVRRSVLFRGVSVGKGASVQGCVLMPGTTVGEGVRLENVVTDKNVHIRPGRTLIGYETYPVFIAKGVTV